MVRIEFSPLIEIDVTKIHYYPEETTDKGPTRVDAETGTFLKLTSKPISYDSSRTGRILFLFILFHIKYNQTS